MESAETDGQKISGVFGRTLVSRHPSPIVICENFLNAEGPDAILRFTRRYGPLVYQYDGGDLPFGLPFSFPVQDWLKFQYDIKVQWGCTASEMWAVSVGKNLDGMPVAEEFLISKRGHAFRFADLSRLIYFFLYILEREKQKTCARPDCRKAFFANKTSDKYCGAEECKQWGQRRDKRDTWNRNKEKYAALRRQKLAMKGAGNAKRSNRKN